MTSVVPDCPVLWEADDQNLQIFKHTRSLNTLVWRLLESLSPIRMPSIRRNNSTSFGNAVTIIHPKPSVTEGDGAQSYSIALFSRYHDQRAR